MGHAPSLHLVINLAPTHAHRENVKHVSSRPIVTVDIWIDSFVPSPPPRPPPPLHHSLYVPFLLASTSPRHQLQRRLFLRRHLIIFVLHVLVWRVLTINTNLAGILSSFRFFLLHVCLLCLWWRSVHIYWSAALNPVTPFSTASCRLFTQHLPRHWLNFKVEAGPCSSSTWLALMAHLGGSFLIPRPCRPH